MHVSQIVAFLCEHNESKPQSLFSQLSSELISIFLNFWTSGKFENYAVATCIKATISLTKNSSDPKTANYYIDYSIANFSHLSKLTKEMR